MDENAPAADTTESPSPQPQTGGAADRPAVRWWPAVVIVLVAGLAMAAIRTNPDTLRSQVLVGSLKIGGVATAALAVWFWFFARIAARTRWKTVAAALPGSTGAPSVGEEVLEGGEKKRAKAAPFRVGGPENVAAQELHEKRLRRILRVG